MTTWDQTVQQAIDDAVAECEGDLDVAAHVVYSTPTGHSDIVIGDVHDLPELERMIAARVNNQGN
jgi:hypothetical protein